MRSDPGRSTTRSPSPSTTRSSCSAPARRPSSSRRPLAPPAHAAPARAARAARRHRPRLRPLLRPGGRRCDRDRRAHALPRPRAERAPAGRVPDPRRDAGLVGDPQVRHRGTIGGSVAHCDPASTRRRSCSRSTPSSSWRRARSGERRLPIAESFGGFLQTALDPAEVLTEIRVPKTGRGRRLGLREVHAAGPGLGHRRRRRGAHERRRPRRAHEHGRHRAARGRRRGGARGRRRPRGRGGARRRGHEPAERPQRRSAEYRRGTSPACSRSGAWSSGSELAGANPPGAARCPRSRRTTSRSPTPRSRSAGTRSRASRAASSPTRSSAWPRAPTCGRPCWPSRTTARGPSRARALRRDKRLAHADWELGMGEHRHYGRALVERARSRTFSAGSLNLDL